MAVDAIQLSEQYRTWLWQAGLFVVTFAGVYALGRLTVVPSVTRAVDYRNRNNPTVVQAVQLYLKVGLVALAFPIGIAAAGLGRFLSGSAILVAAVTLAVGVAGRDVISNLVSGVFLVADRNFNVGDYIRWSDRGGTVVRVGLRTTRVRTPSNEIVTVPNNDLSTMPVTHPFDGVRYRIEEPLHLGYGTDLARVREVLTNAAEADDRVLDTPEPSVHVGSLGPDSLEVNVLYWIVDPGETDVQGTRTAIAERLTDRLRQAGVTVAPASGQELSGEVTVHGRD